MSKVEELINPITEEWDIELIREIFWLQDVETILSIPVLVGLTDVVAWHKDSKGMFSIQSAYRIQCDHERRNSRRGVASSSSGTSYPELE